MKNMEKMRSKIRVGLILDSFDVPIWTYYLIKKLKESDYITISDIIYNSKSISKKNMENLVIQKAKKKTNWLLNLYEKYERKRINLVEDLIDSKNCKKILEEILMEKEIHKTRECNEFSDNIINEQLKKYDLDVIINLSFKNISESMLNRSRFGVWSYRCMNNSDKIDMTGFWEVYENRPVTCTILEMLKEKNDIKVIDLSFSFTDHLYFLKNRMNQNWKKTIMIPRKLKKMYENDEESVFEYDDVGNFYNNECYTPTNIQVLNFFARHVQKYFKIKKKYSHKIEQWGLLFYLKQKDPQLQKGFQKIIPPNDRFYADPFIVKRDDIYFVFIEEFLYGQNKGHISYLKINQDGEYSEPKKILECPYHMSYPFIFKFKNEYYMIPETSENKSIDLYKCTKFPDEWEFVKSIMKNFVALDSTILEKDGKWWLFTSSPEMNESPNDTLYLFHSDDLLNGEWISHPKNPIISDVRKARSAGKLFEIENKFYRPGQDCSIGYGRGIRFNLIKTLNEKNYEELTFGTIYSQDKEIEGIHTYSKDDDLTVFDFKILIDK